MADRKISDLTALTTPASGDYLPIVDISEASAANKNKRITIEELLRGAPDGTAGAPGIAFESDPNTGIYSPGADQLAISTNGTGRLFVDASGNVGIGAASAGAALDVVGQVKSSTLFNVNGQGFIRGDTSGELRIQAGTSGVMFRNNDNNTEFARIDSSGRLGLGTSSPSNTLHVVGTGRFNVSGANNAVLASDGGDPFFYTEQAAGLKFGTNSAVRMTINSSGSVGIGTTASPAGASIKLTLDGSNGGGIELVAANDGGGALVPSAGGGVQFYTHTGAVGSESYSERARIDGAGRLLVGTSSARSTGVLGAGQAQIESSGYAALQLFGNPNSVDGSYIGLWKSRSNSPGGTTIVQDNDNLGGFFFGGYDGTNAIPGAAILAEVDGTPGANDMPGRLVFSTTADGASSPTERMRITSAGVLQVADATDAATVITQLNDLLAKLRTLGIIAT